MAKTTQRSKVAYVGSFDLAVPKGTTVVSSDADYVLACRQLSGGIPQTLWVRQKVHYSWLRGFVDRTGLPVDFVEMTPRTVFAEQAGLAIPTWLDDETVTTQGLLQITFPGDHPKQFVDAMLVSLVGAPFRADTLEAAGLAQAMAAVTSSAALQNVQKHPVLQRCLKEKCGLWAERTAEVWAKDTCGRMASDADGLWSELTAWALLAKYPGKLLEYLLPAERAVTIRKVPAVEVRDLPLHRVAAEQGATQIDLFFKDVGPQVKTPQDITKVVGCVSGRIAREFQLVESLLEGAPVEPSQADLQAIRDAFRECPGVPAARLAGLSRFVRPPRPRGPSEKTQWTADEWIRWTVDEYLPYRHWQVQNRKCDPTVESAVESFTDWYVQEYAGIHQDQARSLVHALTSQRADIIRDQLAMVLVVDCLPATFWPLLQDALQKAGFYRHAVDYRFAPLPSHTSVSKPRLLSGLWEQSAKGYPAIVAERAGNDWGGKKAVYLPDLKSLSELPSPGEPTVLVLNFLPADETLHSDVESHNSSYGEDLYRLFSRLADSLREFVDRWSGQKDGFGLYVMTDHGASRILSEETQTLDSKVTSKLFPDEKHRFSAVPDAEAASVPANLWALGYRFKQPFGAEPVTYFIPRAHNTVRLAGAQGMYVHGGATPEEVVVPVAVFRSVKATSQQPAARFSGLRQDPATGKAIFYAQRLVTVPIVVQNPNRDPIVIRRIEVLTPDAEVKTFTALSIGGGEERELSLSCIFGAAAKGKDELAVQIVYDIGGDDRAVQLRTAAEFKSAQTAGINLKDLV